MSSTIREKIEEVSQNIAKEFSPQKIILFGSYAWGKPSRNSDVDFLVIKDTNNSRELARKIDGFIFPRPFPVDVLVYTSNQLKRQANDFFVQDILTKGKVLYEKR